MKFKYTIFSLIFILLISVSVYGQTQVKSSVSGIIIEKKTKESLEFVNVSLHRSTDSTLIFGAVTDKNGEFILTNVPSGKYYIQMNSMGFEPALIPDFSVKENSPLNLGTQSLKVSNI